MAEQSAGNGGEKGKKGEGEGGRLAKERDEMLLAAREGLGQMCYLLMQARPAATPPGMDLHSGSGRL